MKLLPLLFLVLILSGCNNQNSPVGEQSKEEVVQEEFTIEGTTWKTEKGGVIIFSEDEKGKFLYGNEEKNKYLDGEYTKFGDKYSLKQAGGEFSMIGFISNFGASPLVITIDDSSPRAFSFTKTDIEKYGANYRKVEKTIIFTIVE